MTILTIKGHDSLLVSRKMNSGSLNIIFIHGGSGGGDCGGVDSGGGDCDGGDCGGVDRIKKWSIVLSQIRFHKSKQKPFVVCCAEGIIPRFGEDGFQIVAKLSACQISGIRGEVFGKLHIKVLLTQGYPGEKI